MKRCLYMALLPLLAILNSCTESTRKNADVIFCDAEKTVLLTNQFECDGYFFEEAKGASTDEAYSGKQSCLVNSSNPVGMVYTITNPKPGEIFKVSAFRKSSDNIGAIMFTSEDQSYQKIQSVGYGKKDENGWEFLSFNVQLPFNFDTTQTLKIHVFNRDKKGRNAYFDDLKIVRLDLKQNDEAKGDKANQINIQLLDEDFAELIRYRDQALAQGVISKELKKEFYGTLTYKGEPFRIGIRLKGDWTDHLTGYKWSYRIKIKNKKAFLGLKTFSIQAPEIRSFLNEWVIHEACLNEDLLTTAYEFLPVSMNGVNLGVYNLEEHFEKQLLESKKRREGPILKFSEDGFWERNLHLKETGNEPDKPIFAAATILPFKLKKTLKKEKLANQFLIGQNLMQNYKQGSPNTPDFLDLERLAKVYALMSVFNTDHAITWHNQRLYYNPINAKLEFIVYDCFSGPGSEYLRKVDIFGNDSTGAHEISNPMSYLIKNSFDDPNFLEYYLKYLKSFSSESYLNSLLTQLDPAIDSLGQLLQNDYSYYNYDKSLIKSNAKIIRSLLPEYEAKVEKKAIRYELKQNDDLDCISEVPFKNFSINAHIEDITPNGKSLISLTNFHCMPVKLIGYTSKGYSDSILPINKSVILDKYSIDNKIVTTSLNHKPKKIYFKVLGASNDSLYASKVNKWPRPQLELAHLKTVDIELNPNSAVYSLNHDTVIFRKGKHTLKESIVIPKNRHVIFEAGTELILNKGLFFMSHSAVKMIGTKELPIKVSSLDKTANGFTVLQAKGNSQLDHVMFDGLNTFNIGGWELTGAVTFFESDVNILNTTFANNNCEDGLNIVKSKFLLDNCTITNTLLDGFDGDFCTGTVQNSHFNTTGNDCIDFSGSTITVVDCDIKNSGDKGISCGEGSTVTIENVSITNAVIGIASKDQSLATVNNLKMTNCDTGYSIFEKKAEYGPAKVVVKSHTLSEVQLTSNCQQGSTITIQ